MAAPSERSRVELAVRQNGLPRSLGSGGRGQAQLAAVKRDTLAAKRSDGDQGVSGAAAQACLLTLAQAAAAGSSDESDSAPAPRSPLSPRPNERTLSAISEQTSREARTTDGPSSGADDTASDTDAATAAQAARDRREGERGMRTESNVKSGYLMKKGERRKVRLTSRRSC